MPGWTSQQVLGLAPDAASAKAGQALATPRPWTELGCDERAVWGLCQGSGKRPYQTQAELSEPAFSCSCPSRKVPCKHVLALLLLWAGGDVPPGEPPQWVSEWLGSREARAQRAQQRAAAPPRAPDPEAQARRAARREERVAAGAQELRRWLADLVRRGLSEAQQQSWDFWDEPAARMVDAQASGLASRVRRMASARASGDAWAERVLEEAALLQLLLEAHGRLGELPEATREDVRQLIGWAVPTERVLERSWVRDEWAVVGQVTVEDDRLRSQRTWLHGASGADALILAFAPPGAVLEPGLAPGTSIDASLAFHPGAVPLRAVLAERHGEPEPLPRLPGHATVAEALAARAEALAGNPWIDRWPVAIEGARPARDGDRWAIADGEGGVLAVRGTPWELLAVSGGRPVDVFGELEGDRLRPLSVAADGRVVALT